MSTLNYQQGGDARREDWGRLRLRVFGPSRDQVWSQLAQEIGGDVVSRGFWRGKAVVAHVESWTVTLDLMHVDKMVFTRLRALYVNPDDFRFNVRRRNVFSGLAEALGFHDVQVGYPAFDRAFVVKGTSEKKLRQLFANPRLRSLLSANPGSVHFQVRDDEGWFGKTFPKGVDEVRLITPGVVKDVDRLKGLFDLFAETLHTLCHMGSAYEDDPGLEL
jgi:hypothetical protein